MIKKIYRDSINEEDLNNFINNERVQNVLNNLHNDDEEYIIAMDIASKNSTDNSCIMYFSKDENDNFIFKGELMV